MQDNNPVPVEDTEVPQEEVLDTTEESEAAPQPEDSEAHEEEQIEATPEISEEEFNRLRVKAQKLETEKAQIAKQNAAYGEYVLEDEDRTKAYLKRQGLDEQKIADALDRIKQSRPGIWQKKEEVKETQVASDKGPIPTQPIDVQKIKQEIRDEMTLDTYVKQSQQEFMAAVPEMNPKNYMDASEEDRRLVAEFADKVDYLAKAMMRIQPLSYKDALVNSYNTLKAQLGGDEVDVKKEGYLEGLAEKNADNATSFGEMASEPEPRSSVMLTQQERTMAKKLGMTEEEYGKYKR